MPTHRSARTHGDRLALSAPRGHRPAALSQDARPDDPTSGYVTAEAAVVLPVLLVVLAMAVSVLACVGAELRCVDAARDGARSAARGDTAAVAVAAARRAAPGGASVRLQRSGDVLTVEVSASVHLLGKALRALPAVHVRSTATAEREDVPAGGGR